MEKGKNLTSKIFIATSDGHHHDLVREVYPDRQEGYSNPAASQATIKNADFSGVRFFGFGDGFAMRNRQSGAEFDIHIGGWVPGEEHGPRMVEALEARTEKRPITVVLC
jgi:hypothetical protein